MISDENQLKAAYTMQEAAATMLRTADQMQQTADQMQQITQRLELLLGVGYGSNIERLIDALEKANRLAVPKIPD